MACTPTGETPFRFAFRNEAVVLVKVGMTSYLVSHHNKEKNEEGMHLQLDLLDEVRSMIE